MILPPNVTLCNVCLGLGSHRLGCPEADDPAENATTCGLCGCDLEDDDVQLCGDCAAEHPGD